MRSRTSPSLALAHMVTLLATGGLALGGLVPGGLVLGGLVGCGDDSVAGQGGAGGDGGQGATTVATTAATTVATTTGGGGEGGAGPDSCGDGCADDAAVCQDGVCVEACDGGRSACDTAGSDVDECCGPGTQCCAVEGAAISVCKQACDITCPDGETTCAGTSLCLAAQGAEPTEEPWSCIEAAVCGELRACGDTCCPLGSRCDEGECKLADIYADADVLSASLELENQNFAETSCELFEGCIDAPGDRRLLKFSLRTPNDGEGDLFLGCTPESTDPDCVGAAVPQDVYEFSACHAHYHFNTYANYRLLDPAGRVAATGHKQAFCLMDFEGPAGQEIYDCDFQGIQAGFSDIYGSYLPCQWIDVTEVAPGDYRLEISLNTDRVLAESNYDNNLLLVDVTIAENSCAGGCNVWDPAVCQAGDPLLRAGDGMCDCSGLFEWDAVDCASCDGCPTTSCPGGCSADDAEGCCGDQDTCGLAGDGVCNCGGDAAWDEVDCGDCISADAQCPGVNSCPEGCGWTGNQCDGQVIEEGQGDGWCDCGDEGWDSIDCFSCPQACGQN